VHWRTPRIMHQCAEAGFKNVSFVEMCLDRGVVDYGSDDFETPSACAVLSRYFMLAGSSMIGVQTSMRASSGASNGAALLQSCFACTWKGSRKGQCLISTSWFARSLSWADLQSCHATLDFAETTSNRLRTCIARLPQRELPAWRDAGEARLYIWPQSKPILRW
jgi:hypothetical protein